MAVDMFIEYPDTAELKGETKDSVYKTKNASDVLAWSWGMSNSGSAHVGGGAVSYTHLDVYKRQVCGGGTNASRRCPI